mgnify:CR=1 FL=1
MPTQPLPRGVLIEIAKKLYESNKYCLSITGRDIAKPYVVASEIEPGFEVPSDFIKGLKQLQKYIPSLKKFNIASGQVPRIDLVVDPSKFSDELVGFVKKAQELKRLISRDENGTFWFKAGQLKIHPKKTDADYWKIFTVIFEVAMNGPEKEKDFYLATYKKLKIALSKKLPKVIYMSIQEFMNFIRRTVNLQFRRRPQSFRLSQSDFNRHEILSVDKGVGVKLYNPEI